MIESQDTYSLFPEAQGEPDLGPLQLQPAHAAAVADLFKTLFATQQHDSVITTVLRELMNGAQIGEFDGAESSIRNSDHVGHEFLVLGAIRAKTAQLANEVLSFYHRAESGLEHDVYEDDVIRAAAAFFGLPESAVVESADHERRHSAVPAIR